MRISSLLCVGLAVAILSIGPAAAATGKKPARAAQTSRAAQWLALKTYEECVPFVMQNAWTSTEAWYICGWRDFND